MINNTLRFCLLLLGPLFLFVSCGGQALEPDPALIELTTPNPVIVDSDMAHDDMFAILYLLAHPNVDVRAITVAGTGEVHCGPGVANALGLAALSDQESIPVSCGRELPLAGNHAFPAQWRQNADRAYGVEIPPGGKQDPLSAPDLIISILKNSDQKISIVAVGPLTNVAEAIQIDPEILSKIDRIFIMGGAVDVGGNVGPSNVSINNDYAEWNFYVDPQAAGIVLASGVPITLVPLDATRDVPVTRDFYRALGNHRETAGANLVYELMSANLDLIDRGGFEFWDSLTAAIFTDESLAAFEEMPLTVVQEEGPESGRTVRADSGSSLGVAKSADREGFEQLFLTILNWQ
jgi:pyrimidine-specific ribonucleoside hydrolase